MLLSCIVIAYVLYANAHMYYDVIFFFHADILYMYIVVIACNVMNDSIATSMCVILMNNSIATSLHAMFDERLYCYVIATVGFLQFT